MDKINYPFAIALANYEAEESELEQVQKEYDLTDEQVKELKPAYLFRLSDNVQYWQYDADFVFWSADS